VPPVQNELCEAAQEAYELFVEIPRLDSADLYAGKLCAALDRQHPRDLFDVMHLQAAGAIPDSIRRAFVAYLAGHRRRIAELLQPNRKPIRVAPLGPPDLQWTGTAGGPAARPYRPQVTPSDGYAGGSGRSCRACRKGSCTRRQFGLFNLFNTLAKASCRDRVYHCQPTAQIHLAPYFQNEQTHYADVVSP